MKSYSTRTFATLALSATAAPERRKLVSSLLYTAGMTPRWGKVAEGSTTTDWDEEEIQRKIFDSNRPGLRRVALHTL